MALINSKDFSELKRFRLNFNQLKILFSLQYLITKEDIGKTKGQKRFSKRQWLQSWSASIHDYLEVLDPEHIRQFYTPNEMKQAVNEEAIKAPSNKTWYPIVILEATLFIPYTELRRNKADDKEYSRLKFTKQTRYIKEIIGERSSVKAEDVDRFEKTYKKALSQLKEVSPIIAVISRGEVPELKGVGLTPTSLAAAGCGVITIDQEEIAGGGALLGIAGSGQSIGAMNILMASFPDFTLLQAARLEVVVKEIILNKRKNIVVAKHILEDYAEQINKISRYIQDLALGDITEENRKRVRNLSKSLKYMQKAYVNINTFKSYCNIGMEN